MLCVCHLICEVPELPLPTQNRANIDYHPNIPWYRDSRVAPHVCAGDLVAKPFVTLIATHQG